MDLQGQLGELSFKVQVTRKDTGKVEEFDLVGIINQEQRAALEEAGFEIKEQ